MEIDINPLTVGKLLSAKNRYLIPRFQREYSWDVVEAITLFHDLCHQKNWDAEVPSGSEHYLGTMLFLGNRSDSELFVIDGQQRLTTLTLLLAALRDSFALCERGVERLADSLQSKYLLHKDSNGLYYPALNSDTSWPFFERMIQRTDQPIDPVSPISPEEVRINRVFSSYLELLEQDKIYSSLMKRNDEGELAASGYVEVLKGIRDQILAAKLVAIYVAEPRYAYQIFEDINSKGKPLSQVDLMKNRMFSILINDTGDDEPNDIWKKLKERFNALTNVTFNDYLLDYWRATFPEDKAGPSNLYRKYLRRYENANRETVTKLLIDVKTKSTNYVRIMEPDANSYSRQDSKYEFEYLSFLSRLNVTQMRSALLAFYAKPEKKSKRIKLKLLQFLSNFNFAVFGLRQGLRANRLTGPYRNFVKAINESNSGNKISGAVDDLIGELALLVEKDNFLEKFAELSFSKHKENLGTPDYAKYALYQLSNSMADEDHKRGDGSIEHIIDEGCGQDTCINIGNLLVLEKKLNEEAGRTTVDANPEDQLSLKIPIYEKSNMPMVESFLEKYAETSSFGNDEIKERAQYLAQLYWDTFFLPYTSDGGT